MRFIITVSMVADGSLKATVQIKPNKNLWPSITYLKYNVYFVRNVAAGNLAWRSRRIITDCKPWQIRSKRAIAYFVSLSRASTRICAASHRIWHGGSIHFYVRFLAFLLSILISLYFCILYCGYVTVFANNTEHKGAVRRVGTPNDPSMYRIKHNVHHLSLPPAFPLNDGESCPLST
jgi:hypothetical protein